MERCLESFRLYRPVANYEIIVVDNDSQDENLAIFEKKFTDVTFIKNSGNYGFSNGCNLGAKHASGKFLLFLNPDIIPVIINLGEFNELCPKGALMLMFLIFK